jgi:hypothetical protein
MRFFTRCLFILLFLAILLGFIITVTLGHDGWIEMIIARFYLQKNASKIYELLTVSRFHQLQCLVFIVLLSLALILFYFNRIYAIIAFYVRDFASVIKASCRLCLRSEAKYILILPLLASVWFAVQLPISYDEAFTYLNFTSRGPLVSIFYYPGPNNHILHSLITTITTFIPFLSTCFCLRISSIIINLLTWCIAYSFLATHFTKRTALVVVTIASLLFMSIYYSCMSRGYALVSLFFVTALYAAFNIVKNGSDKRNWIAFAVSSILGFYAMPSFLYAFLSLNAFIFLSRPQIVKKQFAVNVVIFLITACLYLPVIIANGIDALVNNQFVAPLPRMEVLQKLPAFFNTAITEITGIPWTYVLTLLIVAILGSIFKKDKIIVLFCVIFMVSPFVWLLLHGVIPFSRTFVYYNFIIVFILVVPLRNWLDKRRSAYLFAALLLIQGVLLWNFNSQIYRWEDYSIVTHGICKQIEGNKKYGCDDGLFDTYLRFELKMDGFNKPEIKYFGQIEMNADTVYNLDYIVIQKNLDRTIHKQPIIETPYYRIYN